jgi:hypothetical protein
VGELVGRGDVRALGGAPWRKCVLIGLHEVREVELEGVRAKP